MPMLASGQINQDLARLVRQMDIDDLKAALTALLRSRFGHLGEIVEHRGLRKARFGGVSLRVGRYLIHVSGSRVLVSPGGRKQRGDSKVMREIQEAIIELLIGLAGMALQRRLVRSVLNAGYNVGPVEREADGSIVMEVEL
jgi:hypothetical protein